MMKGIFTLLFCLSASMMFAQKPTSPGTAVGQFASFQSGPWSDANSWSRWDGANWVWPAPSTPTNASNTVVIQLAHVIDITTLTLTIDQVTVSASATLRILSPAAVTIANTAGDQLTVNGTLEVAAGATLTKALISTSVIQVNGTVNCSGQILNTTPSRMFFNAGSSYNLMYPGNRIPMATWNTTSTATVKDRADDVPIGVSQSFGNFVWDTPSSIQDVTFNGTLPVIQGNLSILNTAGFTLFFTITNPYTLSVPGNFTIGSGATVGLTNDQDATINVTGNFTNGGTVVGTYDVGNINLNVIGNVNLTAGTFDAGVSTGTSVLTVTGNYTNTGTAIVKSESPVTTAMSIRFNGAGVQNFTSALATSAPINFFTTGTSNLTVAATSFLAGTGTLAVGSTSFLTLLSTATTGALQANTTGGNVRVSGTRTYNGTVVYGAGTRQYMATSHPGTANTRIANPGGVTMLGSVAFTTGVLSLNSGLLRIENSSTLTVESVANNGGFLGINANSSIVINGSGAFGSLALRHISGTAMRNLTINRASGSVTQATTSLTITGTTTLSQGTLALGAGTTSVISGPFSVTAGAMTSVVSAKLTINGSGTMPTGVSIVGALNTLQVNRPGTDLNLTNSSPNNLTLTRLNLYGGTITNAGGLRMANSSTIYRTNGSLTNAIGAVGVYSVQYTTFSAADLPIGFEIPTSGTALNNFTINNTIAGTHNVSLTRLLRVGGLLTVTRGGLVTNNNNISVKRNFSIAAAGSFAPGSSTITFDGSTTQTFGGPTTYTINNLIIAKTARSNFTLNSPVNIQTSFAITTQRSIATVGTNRLTLLSNSITTAYIPTLFSDAGGTSSIVGTVIVQRQLPNTNGTRAYRYIAPTVTNSFVSDWQAEFPISGKFSNPSTGTFGGVKIVPANPSLFYYNEALVTGSAALTDGYVAYPSSGNSAAAPLVNGRGYSAFVRTKGALTYDTRGTLGQNNITVNCTFSGGTNGGWNLIGNPYPAPVDWDATVLQKTGGVGSAIYLTDNTNSAGAGSGITVSYIPGIGGTGTFDGIIASGQAFFVNATSAGTVRFRENQKFSGQTRFIRESTPENVLKIKMKTGAVLDNILVHIGDSATLDFDQNYDAYKYGAFGVNIATLSSSNDRLSINSFGRNDCNTVIPFDIEGGVVGTYTLDFSGLETFTTQVDPVLYDKLLDKRIDITTTRQYTFSVADTATIRRRFQLLFDAPTVQTALELTGEAVCEDNTVGYISLESSQADVKYTAMLNGSTVSSQVDGTGAPLQIPIQLSSLSDGENEITISAQRLTCNAKLLDNKATITIVRKGSITETKEGSICGAGSTSLSATGNNAIVFNWYEDIADINPIADQHGSNFVTPTLNKTKTYYVAAVNTQDCEGERVAVMANVANLTPATITAEGTKLSSNYDKGNQWYLDGQAISGATKQDIEVLSSGIYSVMVSADNCTTTSEGREMVVTEVEEIGNVGVRVFPNPAADKVRIEIKTKEEVLATLISQTGVQLNNIKLSGTQDMKSGEFNLGSLPDGIYVIRINEGNKVYTKKISKIK